MSTLDLDKRNAVIRKYVPEAFEEEPPAEKEKLLDAGRNPIDALMLVFDDDDESEEMWYSAGGGIGRVSVEDDEQIRGAMRELRAEPTQSDTIILDVTALSKAAGQDMRGAAMSVLFNPSARWRGLSQEALARELLDSGAGGGEAQAMPSLSLEEFFDGNTDEHSIAPNAVGYGHPGLRVFKEVLERIRSEDRVVDVRIEVHEWPEPGAPGDDDMWIAAERVFFWTRGVSQEELAEWTKPLVPTAVGPAHGLPTHGPTVDGETQVFAAVWD